MGNIVEISLSSYSFRFVIRKMSKSFLYVCHMSFGATKC